MHIEHRIGPPAGRPAALTVTDDGDLIVCVDAALSDDEQGAAIRRLLDAVREI